MRDGEYLQTLQTKEEKKEGNERWERRWHGAPEVLILPWDRGGSNSGR
jgi:hypothetical protein